MYYIILRRSVLHISKCKLRKHHTRPEVAAPLIARRDTCVLIVTPKTVKRLVQSGRPLANSTGQRETRGPCSRQPHADPALPRAPPHCHGERPTDDGEGISVREPTAKGSGW